jgi:hypothetical protein
MEKWLLIVWALYRNRPSIELKLRNGLQLEGLPLWAYQMSGIAYMGGDVRRASDELIEFAFNGRIITLYGWLYGDPGSLGAIKRIFPS